MDAITTIKGNDMSKTDKPQQEEAMKTVQMDAETHALLGKVQEAIEAGDPLGRNVSKSLAIRYALLIAAKELKIKL